MGWKGTLRKLEAANRSIERDARRHRRALERQRAQLAKMEALERATHAVELYNNHIDILQSVHKECGNRWDWTSVYEEPPPERPTRSQRQERAAQARFDAFNPSLLTKLLGRTETAEEQLAQSVTSARWADERDQQEALETYEREHAEWEAAHQLAGRVLDHDLSAFTEAIEQAHPWTEIEGLGSSIRFDAGDSSLMEITLRVHDEEVIPKDSVTLLKSGKLSVKPMTKTRFYGIYQDYVCGCVLRIARELFALLPYEMTFVTAEGELLNTQTGHLEMQPMLSVAIPRKTLEGLDFDRLDASDSMRNFLHRMKFLKTRGFSPVEALLPSDLHA